MKTLTLFACALFIVGCNVGYSPRYYYNNIEAANLTGSDISKVVIQVGERSLSCETVANNAICTERFGKKPYPQEPIQISWQDESGQAQSQQPNPAVPVTLTPSRPLRLIMEINPDGSVKAFFRQDTVYPN